MTADAGASPLDWLPVSTARQPGEDPGETAGPEAAGEIPAEAEPGPGTVRDIQPTTPRPDPAQQETPSHPSSPDPEADAPAAALRDPYHQLDPPGTAGDAQSAEDPAVPTTQASPTEGPGEGQGPPLAAEGPGPEDPGPADPAPVDQPAERPGPLGVAAGLAGTLGRKVFRKEKEPPQDAPGETPTGTGSAAQAPAGPRAEARQDPAATAAPPSDIPIPRLVRTLESVDAQLAESVQREVNTAMSLDKMSERIGRSVEDLTAPSATIHRDATTIAETAEKLTATVTSAVSDIRREGSGPKTPRWFVLLSAAMLVTLALAAGLAVQRYAGILPVPDEAWREYVWDTHGADIARCVLDARRTGGECRVSAIVE